MTPLPCFPRAPRSFGIAATAFALAASAAACGSTPNDVWFLGPLDKDAGPPDATPESATPPQLGTLNQAPCPTGPLVGADQTAVVRSVSVLGDRAIIASGTTVSKWNVDANTGCPIDRVAAFGVAGEVALDGLSSATAVPGGRAIATTSNGMRLLSATGEVVGQQLDAGAFAGPCELSGAEVVARNVVVGANGRGVAAFARSPLYSINTDPAWPEACDLGTLALRSEPFAVAAATRQPDPDGKPVPDTWITVEQRFSFSPLVVAVYDSAGNQLATSEAWSAEGKPGHLCSAAGIVSTASKVIVADGACNRLVVFDAKSLDPTDDATFDGTPRGVALTSAGDALVPIASSADDGAIATFKVVDLH